jgi:hypothetical protein
MLFFMRNKVFSGESKIVAQVLTSGCCYEETSISANAYLSIFGLNIGWNKIS